MKRSEWKHFVDHYLVPELGGRVVRGLALVPGDEWVLRALDMESSDFSPLRFTVRAFVLPMYVPTDHIYYTYGDRVGALDGGSEEWWDQHENNWRQTAAKQIVSEVKPFFEAFGHPKGLITLVETKLVDAATHEPRIQEAVAYSRILSGHLSSAAHSMTLADALARSLNVDWVAAVTERIDRVRRAVDNGREEAMSLFAAWRAQNESVLGISAERGAQRRESGN